MSWKLSCPVLRGGESGDARTLPDWRSLCVGESPLGRFQTIDSSIFIDRILQFSSKHRSTLHHVLEVEAQPNNFRNRWEGLNLNTQLFGSTLT